MNLMGKSDPFLKIYRLSENSTNTAVYKTEVIMNNLSPKWKPLNIGLQQLCNGDRLRPLLIECYDWDRAGTHNYIGSCKTNLEDLLKMGGGAKGQLSFVNKKGANAGILQVDSAQVVERPSFLDYIRG
jgi:Ca2+-dependent lipid-binding protein